MDLSNLNPRSGFPDIPIKTNNTVPGKFKREPGSKLIEKFIVLKPKTDSIKNYIANEKGIKKERNGKNEEYYNALIDNKERTVEESRIQKVGNCMTTIKLSERSLSNFDDKRFYVNNRKSYPLDENMCLFKRDLLNKISQQTSSMANPALINNIKELTIGDDRKLIEVAIRLYN